MHVVVRLHAKSMGYLYQIGLSANHESGLEAGAVEKIGLVLGNAFPRIVAMAGNLRVQFLALERWESSPDIHYLGYGTTRHALAGDGTMKTTFTDFDHAVRERTSVLYASGFLGILLAQVCCQFTRERSGCPPSRGGSRRHASLVAF